MAKSTYEYIISHEPNGSSDQSVKQATKQSRRIIQRTVIVV
ncbi:protein of unknown function [Latilactobacillus sakei]|nr:protein of unknown function [Latilactobacillus sakei]SON67042.1 protein of unknown function [Latilactobacillus sakei]SON67297.1 protein of unknown function [Latilactobacillus sakei]SON67894.1 protein of unknown function [Latilactobacillus sakei]